MVGGREWKRAATYTVLAIVVYFTCIPNSTISECDTICWCGESQKGSLYKFHVQKVAATKHTNYIMSIFLYIRFVVLFSIITPYVERHTLKRNLHYSQLDVAAIECKSINCLSIWRLCRFETVCFIVQLESDQFCCRCVV